MLVGAFAVSVSSPVGVSVGVCVGVEVGDCVGVGGVSVSVGVGVGETPSPPLSPLSYTSPMPAPKRSRAASPPTAAFFLLFSIHLYLSEVLVGYYDALELPLLEPAVVVADSLPTVTWKEPAAVVCATVPSPSAI